MGQALNEAGASGDGSALGIGMVPAQQLVDERARAEAQINTLNRRIDQQKVIIDQQKTTILRLREVLRRAGIRDV